MARGPYWLCSEIKTIGRNLDKTDADLAAMFPGRNVKAVETVRRRFGLAKCPQRAPKLPRYPGIIHAGTYCEHRRGGVE